MIPLLVLSLNPTGLATPPSDPTQDTPPAEASPAAAQGPEDRSYLVRAGLGVGWPLPSEQRDVLEEDGFKTGMRPWFNLDATLSLTPYLGAGVWGAVNATSDTPEDSSRTLHETTWLTGIQLPLILDSGRFVVLFTPRVGLATGTMHFTESSYKTSAVAGAEVSLLLTDFSDGNRPQFGLALGLGLLWAPSPPPGDVGRDHNLGGYYFSIMGVLDG